MKNIGIISMLVLTMCLQSGTNKANTDNMIATIEIHAGKYDRSHTPVNIDLDAITALPVDELMVFEITGDTRIMVPVQVDQQGQRRLVWYLSGETKAGTTRKYELVKSTGYEYVNDKTLTHEGGNYVLLISEKPVLQYNAAEKYPPAGVDQIYKRSGFIHPLYAPSGAVLSNIQPEDHLHHYGLWNPWTKTNFRGEEVDFWNLGKGLGTVKHGGLVYTCEGPVFAGLGALHNHVAWPESTRETKAIKELVDIKVFEAANGQFLTDFSFLMNPEEPIDLEEYRYGGFCLRGVASWTNTTSDFITSEGLDRDHADGERARWCIVSGDTSTGQSGLLMMGNPANFNHPEPLRVWPSDGNNGRGDVFINFSPTRNTTWPLSPENTYLLRYRLIAFDGNMDSVAAEAYWNDYAHPVEVSVKIHNK